MTDFTDLGRPGWDDTTNDCDGRCHDRGLVCDDCEAEALAAADVEAWGEHL